MTPLAAQELRGAGLRVTAARVAILETVRAGDHLDVEAIAVGVRDKVGHVSTQAVYEALHALTAAGLLQRIEPAGSPARYEGRVGDNHHHLVCRQCGRISDVDCAVGHAPCLEPISNAGYQVEQADVMYWGVCPDCQGATRESEPAAKRALPRSPRPRQSGTNEAREKSHHD